MLFKIKIFFLFFIFVLSPLGALSEPEHPQHESSCAHSLFAKSLELHPFEDHFFDDRPHSQQIKKALIFFNENNVSNELIRFEDENNQAQIMLKIKPNNNSRFNQLAKELYAKYEADMLFVPSLMAHDSIGGLVARWNYYGRSTPIILFSLPTLMSFKRLLRNEVILHELRHLKFQDHLKQKIPSPFLGYIKALSGTIPDHSEIKMTAYSEDLSLEEIRTFRSQSRNALMQIRKKLEKGICPKKLCAALETTHDHLNRGLICTNRAIFSLQQAFLFLSLFSPYLSHQIQFEIQEFRDTQYVLAKIENLKIGESTLLIKIPLLESSGIEDDRNLELLIEQVQWSLSEADAAARDFSPILHLIPQLRDPSKTDEELLHIVKSIHSSLRPLLDSQLHLPHQVASQTLKK